MLVKLKPVINIETKKRAKQLYATTLYYTFVNKGSVVCN